MQARLHDILIELGPYTESDTFPPFPTLRDGLFSSTETKALKSLGLEPSEAQYILASISFIITERYRRERIDRYTALLNDILLMSPGNALANDMLLMLQDIRDNCDDIIAGSEMVVEGDNRLSLMFRTKQFEDSLRTAKQWQVDTKRSLGERLEVAFRLVQSHSVRNIAPAA